MNYPATRRAFFGNALALSLGWNIASNSRAMTGSATVQEASAVWRVISRLGYGPNDILWDEVRTAESPRSWALRQIDAAADLAISSAQIPVKLADFNNTLPSIFEGIQKERQARAKVRDSVALKPEPSGLRRFDFSEEYDPLYFSRVLAQQGVAWRLVSSSDPSLENPLLARMTEFWFNHLNVYAGKGSVRPFVGHYAMNVARAYAFGKYEELVLASARHPAMLYYLDQARSIADGSPGEEGKSRGLNENYARELLELHTLGVNGGYSQADVRELARLLTGWSVSPKDETGFKFNSKLHDRGEKQVLGVSFSSPYSLPGEAEGIDAIRMLCRHPSTGKRIAKRLCQFFVADQPPEVLVQRLTEVYLASQGDLRLVMKSLVSSQEFWSPDYRLYKTPMDYACSVLCATKGSTQPRNLAAAAAFLASAGQPVHGWQTPDGYKTDMATWLVPDALTRRADFAFAVARQTPEMTFMEPLLSQSTRWALASEKSAQRAGLVLASPDFMFK